MPHSNLHKFEIRLEDCPPSKFQEGQEVRVITFGRTQPDGTRPADKIERVTLTRAFYESLGLCDCNKPVEKRAKRGDSNTWMYSYKEPGTDLGHSISERDLLKLNPIGDNHESP